MTTPERTRHMRIRLSVVVSLGVLASSACTPSPEARAAEQVRTGISLARAGQPEPAAHAFELATELVPAHYDAWARLARVRLDQRRYVEAHAAAVHVVALRASSAYGHELAGRAALGVGDEPAAVRELERALVIDPGRRYLHVTLGRIHEHAARYPEALASYTTAIDALPGAADPRIGKARVLLGHPPRRARYEIMGPGGLPSGPPAAVRDEAGQLLADARAAKAVTDAQRAEIVRLSSYIDRVRAEEQRRQAVAEAATGRALAQVRSAGILALLGAPSTSSRLASIFGRDTALGNDAENALGGLMGDQIGDSFGYGGLGLRGSGLGGGGTGEGTIGLGHIGTIGHGGGTGGVSGYGSGAGGLGRSRPATVTMRLGSPTVRGSLSSEIVTRILARHSNELRYCYEQGLTRNPTLAGRLVLRFVVTSAGTISTASVTDSTLDDPTLHACVTARARALVFPSAPGIVLVDVPLTFAH